MVRAIDEASGRLGAGWTTVRVGIVHFQARRLMGERLENNPFEVLAHDLPDPRRTPGDYTLLLAGRQFQDGPGFVLFAGTELGAELLLDSSCAAAGQTA
jgi:CDP-diacylglycerol pyrophosphatase